MRQCIFVAGVDLLQTASRVPKRHAQCWKTILVGMPVLLDHPVENSETVYLLPPSARLVPAKTRAFADWIVGELGTRPWMSQVSAD